MSRLLWHPLTSAVLLALVALAGFALDRGGAGWSWLVVGAAAGFAVSGST
ncbi:hypothetical protein [Crossiella cryophila]|uniref:Uncharacterized protein n=1 Tax=Crossiella cryophila TaxID=43355 RepID=A0A7W7C9F8_9PSEU|nr:hypothetical protein [Crossiella cryophila]MBB4675766.1 hypothetical protein [Crossiella cryophila]